jgi:hypothetical protein
MVSKAVEGSSRYMLEREIRRFLEAARPGKPVLYRERRRAVRFHRSVPIFVANVDAHTAEDHRATLDDVSAAGIGFLSEEIFPVGSLLAVKLFWADPHAARVPAIVRHTEIRPHGCFIGAEFVPDNAEACQRVESAVASWYG